MNQDPIADNPLPGPANPPIEPLSASMEFAAEGGPVARHVLRVLLVDDQDDMLSMLHLLMTRRNFEVQTANSPFKALELMQWFEPHVVVSDIGMPDMDGYELMQKLRDQNVSRSFKAIAMTGFDMDADRDQARDAGYDAHLPKPIDFDLLFELIRRLTGQ